MVNIKNPASSASGKDTLLLVAELLEIEKAAWESGFYKKAPKKITATSLLTSFWLMQQSGKNALRNWCFQLGKHIGTTVAEQSLNERLNEKAVEMNKMLLEKALNLKMNKEGLKREKSKLNNLLPLFNRILIRDSTTVQVPNHLHETYPGSNSNGAPTAIMRIQALFNFSEEKWVDFEVSAYTDNDQGAANCIAGYLAPRDLILQDLGYFTLDWLAQATVNQYIITKWKSNVQLLRVNGDKIDLPSLLNGQKEVDMPVLVGSKKQIPMRLVARKLPKAKAKKRIESARKDRHSKANHSKEYYELLKYEIYLTNIPKEQLNGKNIAKLYGLRWYIEILFKSWKSYANFAKVFQKGKMNIQRTQFTVYALLLEFVYLTSGIYSYVKRQINKVTDKQISILKFMDVINDMIGEVLNLNSFRQLSKFIPLFIANATHKKHTKRQNTMTKYLYVNELCSIVSQT